MNDLPTGDDLPTHATAEEIARAAPRFAAVPVGSFEQHGPHLPVTTDTLIAQLLSRGLCDAAGGLLVAPIGVTCSHEHAGFAGSLSISPATLALLVQDLVASIESQGIGLTVLVNGHGGNHVLANVVQQLNASGARPGSGPVRPRVLLLPHRRQWEAACAQAGIESTVSADMHAGEIETSILLHAFPHVVRREAVADHAAPDRGQLAWRGMRHYTASGVIGFPSKATAPKGEALVAELVRAMRLEVEEALAARKGAAPGEGARGA